MKDKEINIDADIAGCEKCRYYKGIEKIERIITVLWGVVKKFIRLLATPILFLFWVTLMIHALSCIVLCIFDFKPKWVRLFSFNFWGLLKGYLAEGVRGIYCKIIIDWKKDTMINSIDYLFNFISSNLFLTSEEEKALEDIIKQTKTPQAHLLAGSEAFLQKGDWLFTKYFLRPLI